MRSEAPVPTTLFKASPPGRDIRLRKVRRRLWISTREAFVLGNFPASTGDEPLYSLLARCACWTGTAASLPVIQAALDGGASGVCVPPPGGIVDLAASLPGGPATTVDALIDRHAASPEAMRRLLSGAVSGWTHGGCEGVGVLRGVTHRHLRLNPYPECTAADISAHGEAACRRVRQLPGRFVRQSRGAVLRRSRRSAAVQTQLMRYPANPSGLPELACPFNQAVAVRLARACEQLPLHRPGVPPAGDGAAAAAQPLL